MQQASIEAAKVAALFDCQLHSRDEVCQGGSLFQELAFDGCSTFFLFLFRPIRKQKGSYELITSAV
jgi:hypothetical protein